MKPTEFKRSIHQTFFSVLNVHVFVLRTWALLSPLSGYYWSATMCI